MPPSLRPATPLGDGITIGRMADSSAAAAAAGSGGKEEEEEARKERETKTALQLVGELQRLFAYMALSKRKMVDPSAVLHALLDSSGKPVKIGNQEDVSEFSHLFLHRVQQGLDGARGGGGTAGGAQGAGGSGVGATDKEMNRIFEGKMLQEVAAESAGNERQVLSSSSLDFLEVILDISHKDLHAALEDYVETALENYVSDTLDSSSSRPGQASMAFRKCVWMQRLPPILTFHLNRVSYDHVQQTAVKVHSPFAFPAILFMDRYMEQHRDEVKQKRQEVAVLRKQIQDLEGRLHSLNHYKYAGSTRSEEASIPKDEHLQAVIATLETEPDTRESDQLVQQCVQLLAARRQAIISERSTLERDLEHQRRLVEASYSHLRAHQYGLLAVLVHDGLAGSGHYWAYIKGTPPGACDGERPAEARAGGGGQGAGAGEGSSGGEEEVWHKYSDMTVTRVDAEEVCVCVCVCVFVCVCL